MEIEILFTEQKWKILNALSKGKYSPMQLAEKSKTTMANISQQLRLLEFSSLVKKEKVPNRDKGKPRTLFSLSDDFSYIISVTNGFADKKLIRVDSLNNIILRSMFLDDSSLNYFAQKFIWSIEDSLEIIDLIAIKPTDDVVETIIVSGNKKECERKIKDIIIKKPKGKSKNFKVKIFDKAEFEKQVNQKKGFFSQMKDFLPLYDPIMLISKSNDGGDY